MVNSGLGEGPAFYVVGAARSGTTAVWTWLQSHPEVFLPKVKEPGFFAFVGRSAVPRRGPYDPDYVSGVITTADAYDHLYEAGRGRISGDVSPVYLINTAAAGRIAAARPDARIVILLRDPVTRAFSQFLQHRRDGLEPHDSFEQALIDEPMRLRQGWSWGHGYRFNGCYAAQIARYLDVFEQEQILFLAYEALQSEPESCWDHLCRHIGLSAWPMPENRRINATSSLISLPAWPRLVRHIHHPGPVQRLVKTCLPASFSRAMRRALDGVTRPVPVLTNRVRRGLVDRYHGERQSLRGMSRLSLDGWCC
ncbi:MAG: hypothetical protein COB16_14550 [Rhodobacteraceae bacterium]|nr:MAG: hypothetical protein COB16_14550 [Paracoccaceae bacterium]